MECIRGNIYTKPEKLKDFCSTIRFCGFEIVMTTGVFDIIHSAHIDYLCEAKKLGNILIVGIDSDNLVKKNKGIKDVGRPIFTELERAKYIIALGFVDLVYVASEWEDIIKIINPDFFVISKSTCSPEEHHYYNLLKKIDTEIIALPPMSQMHSTDIIQRIKNKC